MTSLICWRAGLNKKSVKINVPIVSLQGKSFFPVFLPIWKFLKWFIECHRHHSAFSRKLSFLLSLLKLCCVPQAKSQLLHDTAHKISGLYISLLYPTWDDQVSSPLSTPLRGGDVCPFQNTGGKQGGALLVAFFTRAKVAATEYNWQYFCSELSVHHPHKGKYKNIRNNWGRTWVFLCENPLF